MRLDGIERDDIVMVDKRGRRFHAIVRGHRPGGLDIQPIGRETWRQATAREVIAHWRQTHRQRRAAPERPGNRAQLTLDDGSLEEGSGVEEESGDGA